MAIKRVTNDEASGTCLAGDHGTTDVGPILAKVNETIDQLNLQKNDVNFTFSPKALESDSVNYSVQGRFIFRGSTILGEPSAIKIIAEAVSSSEPGNVRIYDKTNAEQIAEITGINVEDVVIYDLGPLSNIPEDEAMWEIQMQVPTGGANIEVKALTIQWPV